MANNLDDEVERLREVLEGLSRDFANLGSTVTSTTDKEGAASAALNSFNAEVRKATKAAEEHDKKLAAAAEGAKKGLTDFATGLASGLNSADRGLSQYGAGIKSFGDGLGNLAAEAIPGFGIAIKIGIKAFTMATDAVLKQNDAIMKSYDGLGKFGAGLGLSTDQVLQLGNKAGYGSKNLEGLYKAAKDLDGNLAALGGSASGGVKVFAEVASVSDSMRGSFRALGYSQEEVTEMQSQYIKQLGMTGGIQGKTTKELATESQNYILQLNALAEITGKNVKEQQKGQELALQQSNFNAYIYSLQQKREQTTDAAEKKRLDKQIKDYTEFGGLIKNSGLDAETQIAALTSVTAKGSVVIGENNSKLAANGINLQGMKDGLQSGKGALAAYNGFMGDMNKAVKKNSEALGDQAYSLGKTSESMGSFFLLNNENRGALSGWQATMEKANGATQKNVDLTKMTSEELVAYQLTVANSKKEEDKRIQTQVASELAQREFQKATDGLVNILSKAVNPIMTVLFKTLTFGVNIFKSVIQMFDSLTDTVEDIMDLFDDMVIGIRGSTVLQKLFGLKPPTEDELKAQKDRDEKKQKDRDLRDEALWGKDYQQIRTASKYGNVMGPIGGAIAASVVGSNAAERRSIVETAGMTGKGISASSSNTDYQNQNALLSKLAASGISDPRAQANILAQVKAESGGKAKSESLKYSPEQLLKTFPKYFKNIEEAKQVIAQGEEAVGNRIYGGRMGNSANEGYKYRGRGLIQLTGKDNYEKYGKMIGVDLVKNPDMANDPEIAQQLAVAYFKDRGKGKDLTDIKQVGKIVGYVDNNGAETNKRAQYAQSFLSQLPDGGNYPVALNTASSPSVSTPDISSSAAAAPTTAAAATTSSGTTVASSQPAPTDMLASLTSLMDTKLTSLIDAVQQSNSTQNKILQYSRV